MSSSFWGQLTYKPGSTYAHNKIKLALYLLVPPQVAGIAGKELSFWQWSLNRNCIC